MLTRCLVAAALVSALGCGGNSPSAPSTPAPTPPPPIAAAQLVIPANAAFGSSDCDARRSLGAALGLALISGCHFSGVLQNVGPGCAANMHGTTTIVESGGVSSWTVVGTAQPNQLVTYIGGPVSLPTAPYHYQTQLLWDNVRCQ